MSILIAILGLSFLILIHEMGHYWSARWLKVPVVSFSIGFGPLLFKRQNSLGTTFTLRAILLGGYVQFLQQDLPRHKLKAFDKHPVWKRTVIVLAGPLVNLLCAYLIFVALGLTGVTGLKPQIGEILPSSPAAQADLKIGDTLVEVNGRPVYIWRDFVWHALANTGEERLPLKVRGADGAEITTVLDLGGRNLGDIEKRGVQQTLGVGPRRFELSPIVGQVLPGSAAAAAGLKVDDQVAAIDGQAVATWREFSGKIGASVNQELLLKVLRDGRELELSLTPKPSPDDAAIGLAGISVAAPANSEEIYQEFYTTARYPLNQVWRYGFTQTYLAIKLTLDSLHQLLVGILGLDSLGGPIRIVQFVGISFESGLQSFLQMLAFINISLFIFNLLPIPVLDGGHLVLHLIEAARGKKPSDKFIMNYQRIGFVLMASLFIFVTINDLVRLF